LISQNISKAGAEQQGFFSASLADSSHYLPHKNQSFDDFPLKDFLRNDENYAKVP